MATFEIRMKRHRTEEKASTFERLEAFAALEGRTIPNCLEWILDGKGWERWEAFRNTGRVQR